MFGYASNVEIVDLIINIDLKSSKMEILGGGGGCCRLDRRSR